MIDWATFGEVVDALLWLCGCVIVLGAIMGAFFAPDDDRGC